MSANVIQFPEDTTKQCRYPNCTEILTPDWPFQYCEKCRTLTVRNSIALLQDPFSPQPMERDRDVRSTMLTKLTFEELMAHVSKVENHYLELCKIVKLHKPDATVKRPFKDLGEQINEARESIERVSIQAKNQEKREKKRKNSQDKLTELFGGDSSKAKEIMDMPVDW